MTWPRKVRRSLVTIGSWLRERCSGVGGPRAARIRIRRLRSSVTVRTDASFTAFLPGLVSGGKCHLAEISVLAISGRGCEATDNSPLSVADLFMILGKSWAPQRRHGRPLPCRRSRVMFVLEALFRFFLHTHFSYVSCKCSLHL